ncbi:MAG: threonine synthase [Nitrososphaerales archaeon]|nr:threonine synthase [Nitrososphaerales archaeon]
MECSLCGKSYNLNDLIYRCEVCDYPLEVRYDYERIYSSLKKGRLFKDRQYNIWRYIELLPPTRKIISMDEGWTPLIKSERLNERLKVKNLFIKDETRNPTYSFKDRGSSVGVSKAIDIGARFVICASTGNMATSLAAYSARAGIGCVILIPSDTPLEKLTHTLVYSPIVISMGVPYSQLYRFAIELSVKYGFYVVQSDSPMRVEGQKTASFEICEQLDWNVPDKILIPTSSGGNISAYWKGLKEFYELGLINELPQLIAIQAEGCSPIVSAFKNGYDKIRPFDKSRTIAHAISNPDPPSGVRVLKLLRESKGFAESVSDDEMLRAQILLAKYTGIFAEPAGAASIAGLIKLIEDDRIEEDEKIVCVVTGSGLKDIKSISPMIGKPFEANSIDELNNILQTFFVKIQFSNF